MRVASETYAAGPVAVALAVCLVVDCLVRAALAAGGDGDGLRKGDDGDDGELHGD